MRGKWILFGGSVLFLGALLGTLTYLRRQSPPKTQAPKQLNELPAGSEVVLNGRIVAANVTRVAATLDGVVEDMAVQPGEDVYEGQILCRISNTTLVENEKEAAIEEQRAQERLNSLESELIAARLEDSRLSAESSRTRTELMRHEKNYERQRMLNREGATPRLAYEKAETDLAAAKQEADTVESLAAAMRDKIQKKLNEIESSKKALAERAQAHEDSKENLAAAIITSPSDGLVVAVKKGNGEEVTKGAGDLVEIATGLGQLTVVLEPEPKIFSRIKAGAPAMVLIADVPGDGIPGAVKDVSGTNVIVEFNSPSPLVRPGVTAAVRLKLP